MEIIMKIGTLTCARSNDVCTRAGCLNAFNLRKDFFKDYDDTVVLGAMMTCNGCTRDNPLSPDEDPNVAEKIERLVQEKITVMHAGVCRMHNGKECSWLAKIIELIEAKGIRVIRGTHRE